MGEIHLRLNTRLRTAPNIKWFSRYNSAMDCPILLKLGSAEIADEFIDWYNLGSRNYSPERLLEVAMHR